jgi:hypothetical protein
MIARKYSNNNFVVLFQCHITAVNERLDTGVSRSKVPRCNIKLVLALRGAVVLTVRVVQIANIKNNRNPFI